MNPCVVVFVLLLTAQPILAYYPYYGGGYGYGGYPMYGGGYGHYPMYGYGGYPRYGGGGFMNGALRGAMTGAMLGGMMGMMGKKK